MPSPQLIIIVIATYNGEKYLAQQLESIVSQTIPSAFKLKLLFSDDGSSDKTVDIIEAARQKFSHIEMVIKKNPLRMGPAMNFYMAVSAAFDLGADFISLSDQDDFWLPMKLTKALQVLNGTLGPALYMGSASVVNENLQIISRIPGLGTKTSFPSLLLSNQRAGMTFVFNREAATLLFKHPEPATIVMHDWWFELVLCLSEAQIFEDDEQLVLYRQHETNAIGVYSSYLGKIKAGYKRAVRNFSIRSAQANAIGRINIGDCQSKAFMVGALIETIPHSFPALLQILISKDFFANRRGFQKVEARILLVISYSLYHARKEFN